MRAGLFILSFWAVNAYCQFTTVGLGTSMGIMGVLQGIGSSAVSIGNNAINNLNAVNGGTGVNAQQNAAVNQPLNGTPPIGSYNSRVTGSFTVNGLTIDPVTGLPIGGGPVGGGATPQIDPVTGLPIFATGGGPTGMLGAPGGQAGSLPPQSISPPRPIVNPTVMPLPTGNLGPMVSSGKGRKFGPVMRMVSMSGFRVLRSPRRANGAAVINSSTTKEGGQSSILRNAYGDVGGHIQGNPVRPQTSRVSVTRRAVSPSGGRALRVSLRLRNQIR